MHLLRIDDDFNLSLVEYVGSAIPPYAILSHTWFADHEEPTFKDLVERAGKYKAGYSKLTFCSKQAAKEGLEHIWVDTCCIDKSSSSELSEAINSMFRWYRNAATCYVYLSDVSVWPPRGGGVLEEVSEETGASLRKSRWFTRGWTLQELIAPVAVNFYSVEGTWLGDKHTLQQLLCEITGIPVRALQGDLERCTTEERLSWVRGRETKREEDMAYCLLGVFDVHMPLLYGEGRRKALLRLEKEIFDSQAGVATRVSTTTVMSNKSEIVEAFRHARKSLFRRHTTRLMLFGLTLVLGYVVVFVAASRPKGALQRQKKVVV